MTEKIKIIALQPSHCEYKELLLIKWIYGFNLENS